MTTVLPDPATEFGARVVRRLRDEPVAWLTVLDGAGTPQPAPIWFLWDNDSTSALVYSDGMTKRLAHIRAHPRVTLHLDGNGQGGDIVVLTGKAHEDPDAPPVPHNPEYLAKYGDRIIRGWQTAERFSATYSVPLRVRVQRIHGH